MKRVALVLAFVAISAFVWLGSLSSTAQAVRPSIDTPDTPGAEQPSQVRSPDAISSAIKGDVSPPLRSIAPIVPAQGQITEFPEHHIKQDLDFGNVADPVVQKILGPLAMPTPIQNFEGIFNLWGGYPPDTAGDVGPNHYVQIVNVGFQVFSKTGASLYGPANNNTLFQGFGGICEATNRGDPVALYDHLADRWVLTWFAFTSSSGPTSQCFAVSATPDPLGPWYRYAFATGPNFEDYPHLGVWPDAYYMATNTFGGSTTGGNYAFERDRMIEGDPNARVVIFRTNSSAILPSDLDGPPPPPGSPNYFLKWATSTSLAQYRFHVDWANPNNSTFTGPISIPVASFNSSVGGIPQPGTSATLASITDRLMYRVVYRNFGAHEALLASHTVNSGAGTAGVRWYELRNPNGTPAVYQQGTFAPGDGIYRWMGSIGQDHMGNIAIGYSASSTTLYPSIRYAGRLVTDPLGQMAQGEETLITGTGSQTGPGGRWGDYSMMSVDPTDDCTFWYTTEYIQVTGERTWRTRIGSFRFPQCVSSPPTPAPTATGVPPTPLPTNTPIAACFSYVGSITNTDPSQVSRLISVGLPPSTCAAPRSCPGPDTSVNTTHNYDSYTYTNTTTAAQCVTVNVVPGCSNNALTSVAYQGSYDPANKCANYIADGARGGPQNTYSFNLPAGQTAVIIVYEHNGGVGCENYTLNISSAPCGIGPTYTPGAATMTATATAVSTSTRTATMTAIPTNTPTNVIPTIPTSSPTTIVTIVPTTTSIPTTTPISSSPTSTSTATVAATACSITFRDVPSDNTFYANVRCLACRGIISGYADGTFRPNNLVTRGQLAKIVSNAAMFAEPPGAQIFQDVPSDHTFYEWINRLTNRGYMTGYICGSPGEPCINNRPYFRPFNNATRAQTSKIVANAARIETQIPRDRQTFEDVPPDHPFWLWIERLAGPGVMGGYECGTPGEPCIPPARRAYFRPYNDVTRGQSAKIVANTFYPTCQTP